jgi:hypothetical protein
VSDNAFIPLDEQNKDYKEFLALLEAGKEPGKFPYDVVITDTVDKILTYSEEEVMS